MAAIINGRQVAEITGNITVFLIGIRINKPWKPSWLKVFFAMPKMLAELSQKPELGLLHYRLHFGFPGTMVVQYWASRAQLLACAHASNAAHRPAWSAFNRAIGNNGDVGIWHETYEVPVGAAESIYVNMPKFGLAKASKK